MGFKLGDERVQCVYVGCTVALCVYVLVQCVYAKCVCLCSIGVYSLSSVVVQCVRVQSWGVCSFCEEDERFDDITAANYCCSKFHSVCLIYCPVEMDREHIQTHTHTHTHTHRGHKEERGGLSSND